MNIEAVRAFVLVAEHGRFQDAAAELRVTQQAVSKRIAALEQLLGVPLFTRGRRGAELTVDGQAFLPYAKAVLLAVRGAIESVQPRTRALRVDVLGRSLASADLMLDFHERHPDVELDMLTRWPRTSRSASTRRGPTSGWSTCSTRSPTRRP